MKERIPVIFCLFLCSSCFVLQDNGVVYQWSRTLPDTTFIYTLPYARGTVNRVWQGYHSLFSHYGNFAIDFRMNPGTGVHAARGGVVVVVKQEYKWGGVGRRYVGKENAIIIRHSDNTYAHYLHLRHKGSLVVVGDSVRQGQLIGFSGSTGFSAFPHLHFEVTRGLLKAKEEIPVRFHTEKGVAFLQPLRRYRAF